jgi:phosphoglycolate phosphatase
MARLPAILDALVVDFDGTLAEADYDFGGMRERVRVLAGEYGVSARDLDGLYVLEAVERAAEIIGGGTERARAFRAKAQDVILDLEVRAAREGRLLPGAEQALQALHDAGVRVAIVTRNSGAVLDAIAGARRLTYGAFLPREAVPKVKPDPAHLLAALAAVGCEPAHAVMAGDHPMDMQAGKAAGMATAGVLTGAGTRESLTAAGADLIVASVVELSRILTGAARDT